MKSLQQHIAAALAGSIPRSVVVIAGVAAVIGTLILSTVSQTAADQLGTTRKAITDAGEQLRQINDAITAASDQLATTQDPNRGGHSDQDPTVLVNEGSGQT